MTKKPEQTVERKVGERVDVLCNFDPSTVKDLGDGVFEATVTTSEVDRMNESIDTSGIDASTWEKTGMPVLYGHDYSGLPIGKGLSYRSFKNKMTSRFQLAVKEYPFAATVAQLIKGGYLNAVSIGGVVREWSEDYRTILKMEMVEFSVVPIPANASAVITSRSLETATGKTVDEIKEEYQDYARKVLLDKLDGMEEDETKDAIKVLKNLVDRLEETASKPYLTDEKHITRYVLKDAKAVQAQSQKVVKIIKFKES